jgi:hypothetical protein
MPGRPKFVRITAVPPGEAPQWVREKWVGLVLPIATWKKRPITALTSGVLTGPPNRLAALLSGLRGRLQRNTGYAIDANTALAILERASPEAARWWRESVPRLRARNRRFLFHRSVCEPVSEEDAARSDAF